MNEFFKQSIITSLQEAKDYIERYGGKNGRAPVVKIDISEEGTAQQISNMILFISNRDSRVFIATVTPTGWCGYPIAEEELNTDYILFKGGSIATFVTAYFSKETTKRFVYVDLEKKEAFNCTIGNVNHCDYTETIFEIYLEDVERPLEKFWSEYEFNWILLNVCE